jgi:hypothetical protein
MILVKANIEGVIHHLICSELKQDPFLPGRILIAGFNLVLQNGEQPIRLQQISLRPEDVHYYSIVTPEAAPGQKSATPPPSADKPEATAAPDNGVEETGKRKGRRASRGGSTPEA